MQASIDIGNSSIKAGIFNNNKLLEAKEVEAKYLLKYLQQHAVDKVIISSVSENSSLISDLEKSYPNLLKLTAQTPVPLKIEYDTPATLGIDRVAAAIGALSHFDGPLAIVDAGSCITCDLISNKNVFIGGTISPGLQMRLEAMHTLTAKLPLLQLREPKQLIGRSTNEAMISGAVNGARQEIVGVLRQYQTRYPKLKVIICGGDAIYFDKIIEMNIFVLSNLVLEGLNTIMIFNDEL